MDLLDEFVGLLDALLDRHPTAIEGVYPTSNIQHPTNELLRVIPFIVHGQF